MRATQEALLAEMRRWGYRLVVTPSLESLDVLALGLEAEQRRRLFKLTDGDGSILAVVGERTVPVARLAAGKLRSAPLPLRLCYAGPVLSNDPGRFARRRETYQVGAELIGAAGAPADAEVIALAVRCLDAAGLRSYQVDVGHSEFFQGLLDGMRLPEEVRAGVKDALAGRDFAATRSARCCCASPRCAAAPRSWTRPATWCGTGVPSARWRSWRASTASSAPTASGRR
jgi:ATP phosphoribosyltransferase regulatory subunit